MRIVHQSFAVIAILLSFTYGQNPFYSDTEDSVTLQKEAAGQTDAADSSGAAHPFITESGQAATLNVDILLDVTIGASLPKFTVEPDYISTKGKPRLLFNLGCLIPFAKKFYTAIALQYTQFTVELSSEMTTNGPLPVTNTKIISNEEMNFLSLPLQLGMRFDLDKVMPYFYAGIEPAYLTASHQLITQEVITIFPDGSELLHPPNKPDDLNTLSYRQRQQLFIGGGLGLDISYGYGYLYFDVGCKIALLDMDKTVAVKSLPLREKCNVLYFPLTIGIRFFL